MHTRSKRARARWAKQRKRRLITEGLESRQLLAGDFGMFESMLAQRQIPNSMQSQASLIGSMVHEMKANGAGHTEIASAVRESLGNPNINPAVLSRIQANLSPAKIRELHGVQRYAPSSSQPEDPAEQLPPEVIATDLAVDSNPRETASETVLTEIDPPTSQPVEMTETVAENTEAQPEPRVQADLVKVSVEDPKASRPRPRPRVTETAASDRLRERGTNLVMGVDGQVDRETTREVIRERVTERFDGQVPEQLDRLFGEDASLSPGQHLVVGEDGAIDREATRESLREALQNVRDGSETVESIRDRVQERLALNPPEPLAELRSNRRERLQSVDLSNLIVVGDDGKIERDATRESIREALLDLIENGEVINQVRDAVATQFEGELPEQLEQVFGRLETVDPAQWIVTDEEGEIDRDATRAKLRQQISERMEDSALIESLQQLVTERSEGEFPAALRELAQQRNQIDRIQVPRGRAVRLLANRSEGHAEFRERIVRDADGSLDRDATREALLERVANRASNVSPLAAMESLSEVGPDSPTQSVTSLDPIDVNRDGSISPMDALVVMNVLSNASPMNDAMDYDVNGDGEITPRDALQVVNRLTALAADRVPSEPRVVSVDLAFSDDDEGLFEPPGLGFSDAFGRFG